MVSSARSRTSFLSGLAMLVALALGLPVVAVTPVSATTGVSSRARPAPPDPVSVPVKAVPVRRPSADADSASALRTSPAVTWPGAGTADVTLDAPAPSGVRTAQARRAGTLPVWVGPAKVAATARAGTPAAAPAASKVRVEVLDRAAAARAGVAGVLLRLSAVQPAAGRMRVEMDYSGFRHAYGGDWAARLAVVRMPECALTGPATCGTRETVAARNDGKAGRISAEVTGGLFAVTAAPSGSTGSFQPTSLSPSSSWSVGLESGDFGWSYPMKAPEVPGIEPDVTLSYSSGVVDGRTAATNNQPSWAGEGFDLSSGYVERSYVSCKDDGQAGSQDLCWQSDNATLSLPGMSGELVRDDASGQWRVDNDQGWRVERLTGAANGDDDGEYWKVTSTDGTQYFFGRSATANSAWTVPVFGDDVTGGKPEPCHQATFAASWCRQAYRWNLDYVVDRHGDAMAYSYQQETNHYARDGATVTPYTRGGYLASVEYGLRADATTPASARVVFTAADRCVPGTTCAQEQPQNWPDTPWDEACAATSCAVTSPTFWTSKRLAKVTTQVYSGGRYRDVDEWTLTHTFPDSNDIGGRGLWLDAIVHTGLAGGTATLPPVTFSGIRYPNRVDASDDQDAPMNKWRVQKITNETGGQIAVTYTPHTCTPQKLPTADQNRDNCYPSFWMRSGATEPTLDWFHKLVVSRVSEDSGTDSPAQVTDYRYLDPGEALWHHDDSELTPDRYHSWGQWRGYQKVEVRTGDANRGTRTRTEHLFLRGMDDDKTSGGTREVKVPYFRGDDPVDDQPYWRGVALQTTVFDGDGDWLQRTISLPAVLRTSARRVRADGTALEAHLTEERTELGYTNGLADGTVRKTEVTSAYDPDTGNVTEENDLGDLSTPADDTCTTYTYALNKTDWIIDAESRVQTFSVRCDGPRFLPRDLVSDQRFYYDGSKTWGEPPPKGDVTGSEEAASWSGDRPVYSTAGASERDRHGRVVKATDALGNTTTTAYTPELGGPVTQLVTSNALGHATTASFDPLTGNTLATVDPNGRRTEQTYDPLGRVTAAWGPGRSRAAGDSPHARFAYQVRNTGHSVVTTGLLRPNGSYRDSYTLLDGFLRTRQTQVPSPTGGRLISDTFHDDHGRLATSNAAYWNDAPPSGTLVAPLADSKVPAQTRYTYDGADRESTEVFLSMGAEKWRTTTTYGGDWTAVDPPDGEIVTMKLFDADGRTVELRQYTGGSPTGTYDATRYTYTPSGAQSSVTDPAGNVWRYGYDLRGRKVRSEDPDSGVSSYAYDDEDRLVSTTDSRGRTLANTYDALGRMTATYEGSVTGVKLAEWTYDTLPGGKGLPVAARRYAGQNVYSSETLGYQPATGQPTGSRVTLPAAETGLGGTYDTTYTYDSFGRLTTTKLPAAGGLPAETLTQRYDDDTDLPSTLSGLAEYLAGTSYDVFGDVTDVAFGSGDRQVGQSFERDPATRRLTRSKVERASDTDRVVSDRTYTYDPAGNLLSTTDAPEGAAADTQCYRNDYLSRLTEAWTPASGDCGDAPDVNALGGPAPYWHSYTYDKTGNRTSEVRHAAAGNTTRTYTYPAAGAAQPHTLRSVSTAGPGASGTDTYAYDSDGNTTGRTAGGRTQSLTWDAEGHLASVTENGATTAYLYDADGDRIVRRDPAGTTVYLGETELRRDAATGAVSATRYYSQGGTTVAIRTGADDDKLTWIFSDHHGTAEVAIRADDLAVTRRYLLPFGESRGAKPGAWPADRGFVGGTVDPTGLVHLGAREYDPATGRFISVDPVINSDAPQTLNPYTYAASDPVDQLDATGLCAEDYCPQRELGLRRLAANTKDKKLKKRYTQLADNAAKKEVKIYKKYYQKRDRVLASPKYQKDLKKGIAESKRRVAEAKKKEAAAKKKKADEAARKKKEVDKGKKSWLSELGDGLGVVSAATGLVGSVLTFVPGLQPVGATFAAISATTGAASAAAYAIGGDWRKAGKQLGETAAGLVLGGAGRVFTGASKAGSAWARAGNLFNKVTRRAGGVAAAMERHAASARSFTGITGNTYSAATQRRVAKAGQVLLEGPGTIFNVMSVSGGD
ncbi:RHS repeat-associated core domain-containing protein [Nonomuraea roseoviolacea]|uniref:RHS repeat-associated protein n=1 Tax=Nonomuraea roseoviolacea subsp. carminata TaxID=160689 RepID=A0ABT1KB38_9ACTN|nr:RHS repeat-associated core domain-containing protein [Nonomuraea roseoviolacea]MCP2351218.1 RHS repeat-associated protein [Nonomuraea roseoviolacea subsp. carminata]